MTLKISIKDSVNSHIVENLKYQKNHLNKASIFTEIDSLKFRFEKIGFFNNVLDSVSVKDTIYKAYFNLGKSTKLIRIYYDINLVSKKMLFEISSNITDEYFELDIHNISTSLNHLVSQFEKKGNSFTEIKLNNILIDDRFVTAQLDVKTAKQRKIDKIEIKGYIDFPKSFIKHYLNIDSGIVFSSEKLKQASNLLKILPFISETKPPEVLFTKDSTYVYLYVKKKKVNKFDGLIGFSSDQNNNKIQFNGYLDLSLNNMFNGGESISFNWKNSGNDNQLFDLNAAIPYIFNSSLSPKVGLNIYRQDSTFVNTKINLGIGYALNFKSKINATYLSETSSNLRNNLIDDVISYSRNLYGLSYQHFILNNQSLFSTKFNFNLEAFIGNREANKINTQQYQFNLNTNYLWSLNFKNHIFIQNKSSVLVSDSMLTNELFRIGGANSIRGFNEDSIFSSLYSVINLEYRYNTSNQSYLYSISDIGYFQNQILNESQQLFSLGLGYAFTTKLGILNLSYAIGKFSNNPFDFNNSRLHIKIISFF